MDDEEIDRLPSYKTASSSSSNKTKTERKNDTFLFSYMIPSTATHVSPVTFPLASSLGQSHDRAHSVATRHLTLKMSASMEIFLRM